MLTFVQLELTYFMKCLKIKKVKQNVSFLSSAGADVFYEMFKN